MKKLSFLVSSEYNDFASKMVDYLLEAGHSVEVLLANDNLTWSLKYKNQIHLVKPNFQEKSHYDYLLDMSEDVINIPELAKIKFEIESYDGAEINFLVCLIKNEFSYKLVEEKAILLDCNLNNLYIKIRESFIDSILLLMRFDIQEFELLPPRKENEFSLKELLLLEKQIDTLKKHYTDFELENELFSFKDYADLSNKTYSEYNSCKFKLTSQEIQLLLTQLLMLLNARKKIDYKYDFVEGKKCLTKCINAEPILNYTNYLTQLEKELYLITSNKFFDSFKSNSQRAEILAVLTEGNEIEPYQKENYSLIVHYHLYTGELKITYLKELYFFDDLEIYISYFFEKLEVFQKENLAIKELLLNEKKFYFQQLYEWNQNNQYYPKEKTLPQLFQEQVEKHPEVIALIYENIQLSYQEVNNRANNLANYLIKISSIEPDHFIALCLDRSEKVVISMLAVLKCGAAYVPIDPSYPEERIRHLLEDTQPKIILTNQIYKEKLTALTQDNSIFILAIDDSTIQATALANSSQNPITKVKSSDLAYVIYTSGTTGKPKGVMVEHKSVINLATAQINFFNLSSKKKPKNCLWYSNYTFDAHVWEIYSVLLSGHTLHITNDQTRKDFSLLKEYIKKNKISIATIPPVLLNKEEILELDTLIVAGEKANKVILDEYHKQGVKIFNAYGPSEGTVCVSVGEYNGLKKVSNIGKPLSNLTCYILDDNLTPLPVGAVGELYIGGAGIARGYLNLPLLTQQQFIQNPFQTEEESKQNINSKLYKTGDFVIALKDGSREYVGRKDFQVKINGYRIELEEIENILNNYPEVKQSVALSLVREGDIKTLVGYYVAEHPLNEESILTHLHHYLPDYMVPSFIVHLDKLPTNRSGKLEQSKLPIPEFKKNRTHQELPQQKLQIALSEIFAQILSTPKNYQIGLKDNFFELGGNSVLATKLVTAINRRFNCQLRSANIFSACNIEELTNLISQSENNFKLITHLSKNKQAPNLFMIHPGMSGTEVYTSLAKKLSKNYDCYGVDNYNLHHQNKIDNLTALAELYLSAIEEIHKETQEPYLLSGWSIGGLLALKIAYLLEQKNHKNIRVILFDTFLMDDKLISVLDYDFDSLRGFLSRKGHSEEHIINILNNIDCENTVVKQSMGVGKLNYTKILLFKAMLKYDIGILKNYKEETDHYLTNLNYNNLEYISPIENIKLINLYNVTHSSICSEEEVIFQNLISWNKES